MELAFDASLGFADLHAVEPQRAPYAHKRGAVGKHLHSGLFLGSTPLRRKRRLIAPYAAQRRRTDRATTPRPASSNASVPGSGTGAAEVMSARTPVWS